MSFNGKKPKYIASFTTESGIKVKVRKNKPKGCSAPRRICIACKSRTIHKNDSNYTTKICKVCSDTL